MVAFLIPMLLGAAKGAGTAQVAAEGAELDAGAAAEVVGQGAGAGAASGAISGLAGGAAPETSAAVQGPVASGATVDAATAATSGAPVTAAAAQGPMASGASLDTFTPTTAPSGGTDWFSLALKLAGQKKKADQQFDANPLNRIAFNLGLVDRPTTPWLGGTQGPLTPQQEQAQMMANILAPTQQRSGLLGQGVAAIRGLF